MKAIIYEHKANAKRIKVFIPYKRKDFRGEIKKLDTSFWHINQKLWSVVNTRENMDLLKTIFGKDYRIMPCEAPKQIKLRPLGQKAIEAIYELEKTLTLKGFSHSTH